jgi:VWFA-related protein
MRKFCLFAILFCLALASEVAHAQDDDVIRVESSLVRLNVGVVDRKGKPVTDLGRNDFTIYEDGVKQRLLSFEPVAAPFSVVMLLDMSGSTKSFRENIRWSALRFIDALAPDDRVAVIEFYQKTNLLNDFTTNRKLIVNSIKVANGGGDTQLYKALGFALDKLSKEEKRRKAIVVLTDGVDTALRNRDREKLSKLSEDAIPNAIRPDDDESLNRVLNRADAQGVTIYPLALPTGDPARLPDPTPMQFAMFRASRERLNILALRSGGILSAINRLEEMGRLYTEIAADLRTLYTISYQPANEKRDGKFRAIKVELSNPDLVIRTRQGYFAK